MFETLLVQGACLGIKVRGSYTAILFCFLQILSVIFGVTMLVTLSSHSGYGTPYIDSQMKMICFGMFLQVLGLLRNLLDSASRKILFMLLRGNIGDQSNLSETNSVSTFSIIVYLILSFNLAFLPRASGFGPDCAQVSASIFMLSSALITMMVSHLTYKYTSKPKGV